MPNHFAWVPWFKELAANISANDEGYLVDRVKRVNWLTDTSAILGFDDASIDPLSFFYFLAQKNTANQFELVYGSVHEVFDIGASLPTPGDDKTLTIPQPPSNVWSLFRDRKTFSPNLLRQTFMDAVQPEAPRDREADNRFRSVLDIKGVGIRELTQTFYLINPDRYLPIDDDLGMALQDEISPTPEQWNTLIQNGGHSAYLDVVGAIRDLFPACAPYEINMFIYMLQQAGDGGLAQNNRKYFQVSSNVMNKGEDHWEDTDDNRGSFRAARCVYTGGGESPRGLQYPLTTPRPGDIILVRYGLKMGHAIGVVKKNEYADRNGFANDAVIHVFWINKTTAPLKGLPRIGFSNAGQRTVNAFRAVESYRKSLDLLDMLSTPVGDSATESGSGAALESHANIEPPAYDPAGRALNTILYGPPGTGKTYATFRKCVEICDGQTPQSTEEIRARYEELTEQEERVEFVTFHQSYGYEEFVEGLRPQPPGASGAAHGFRLEATDGVLKRIAMRASEEPSMAHVLVIDEINRANVSKVMGELVTLLEEDKREGAANRLAVTLPHSHESFSLPGNLHILGTMNTADRSIALLDTALRRRFAFEELPPRPDLLTVVDGVNLPAVLRVINERLEWFIDRDHLIGHAWLMSARNREDIDNAMRRKIIPLVAEYFYDDWEKARAVFGGGDEFVNRERLRAPPNYDDEGEARYRWTIRDTFPDDAYLRLTDHEPENAEGE